MVEGVPAQVLGIGTVGVTGRHRDEQRGDVAVAGGEHIGHVVRRCSG